MTFVSKSQAGQDRFAYEKIGNYGTFLDIGSNDPIHCSNSLALEQTGWRGLMVDIDPAMVDLCRSRRSNPVLLADATTIDWKKVCQEYSLGPVIDYLSLDVDGLEFPILNNLIAAGLSFKVITCEHDRYHRGDKSRDFIRALLRYNGYKLEVPDVKVYDEHYPEGVEFEDWWILKGEK